MEVEPANAHEFVICCGASSSLFDAVRVASMVRCWLIARRVAGQKWQSLAAPVSLFG
jgi:hypothetical protein